MCPEGLGAKRLGCTGGVVALGVSEHRSHAVGGGELQAWRERKDLTIQALESESRRFYSVG